MKKIWLFLLLQSVISISVFGTVLDNPGTFLEKNEKNTLGYRHSDTTFHVIKAPGNTYGYEILINGKVIIRQQNIPGRPGINGFKERTHAEKIARLVLEKLRMGITPPTIEENELYKLNVNY